MAQQQPWSYKVDYIFINEIRCRPMICVEVSETPPPKKKKTELF
jgi:hypothetical protein